MSIDKTITLQEQMTGLQRELRSIELAIGTAERILSAKPEPKQYLGFPSTLNRYNILQHNRSETLAKIRKLKERMK